MEEVVTSTARWSISARSSGEVLAVQAGGPGLHIGFLGNPSGFTSPEIEGWLTELIGVAGTTGGDSPADPGTASSTALPRVLHQALTGLLFYEAELWAGPGPNRPGCLALVRSGTRLGIGWTGSGNVGLWLERRPFTPEWILVRDQEGLEARALVLDSAGRLEVRLSWPPEGMGPEVASIEALWPGAAPQAVEREDAEQARQLDETTAREALESLIAPSGPGLTMEGGPESSAEAVTPIAPSEPATETQASAARPAARKRGFWHFRGWMDRLSGHHGHQPEPDGEPEPIAHDVPGVPDLIPEPETASAEPPVAQAEATELFAAEPPVAEVAIPEPVTFEPPMVEAAISESVDVEPPVADEQPVQPVAVEPVLADSRPFGSIVADEPALEDQPEAVSPVAGEPALEPALEDEPEAESPVADEPALEDEREARSSVEADSVAETPALDDLWVQSVPAEVVVVEASAPGPDVRPPSEPDLVLMVDPFDLGPLGLAEPVSTIEPLVPRSIVEPVTAPAPVEPVTLEPGVVVEPAAATSRVPAGPAAVRAREPVVEQVSPQAPAVAGMRAAKVPAREVRAAAAPVAEVRVAAAPAPEVRAAEAPGTEVRAAEDPLASFLAQFETDTTVEDRSGAAIPGTASADATPGTGRTAAPPRFAVRRPAWPAPEEDAALDARPYWRKPWFIAVVVVCLFAAGWLLGRVDFAGGGKGLASAFKAIGLGPATYDLTVNSRPSGAWITVDGAERGVRTPATVELKAGSHEILLSFSGVGGSSHTVSGKRGQRETLNVELWGALRVSVFRSGPPITVAMDGMPRGYAPLEISKVQPGIHRLQFSGPGVAPWEQTVEVHVNGTAEVLAQPITSPATGVLEVRATLAGDSGTEPLNGGQVWVDGAARGATPLKLELPRGPHSVRVRYRDVEGPVEVIDLPGGNIRYATIELGMDADAPRLVAGLPGRIPTDRATVLSASLERAREGDVREMWLHVRTPEGAWRRYPMTVMKSAGGLVGVAVFPTVLFDAGGRTAWYVSAATPMGDEYFTEIQPAQAAGRP